MSVAFELLGRDGAARRGRLTTAHGTMETPAFMPVGTAATVKAMTAEMVEATGAETILGNTYHLMLRPTAERVAELGGLHRFMGWRRSILTDSGGFQVMSLAGLRSLDENGVTFKSHLDGAEHRLTPERSIEIQRLLGADVAMAFDECTPHPADHPTARSSMERSMRWAERSMRAFVDQPGCGLFGIVQGSVYDDLRIASLRALEPLNFDGLAIGGLAVGEGQAEMLRVLDGITPAMPEAKPRYLMGVGKPDDLIEAIARGVDMFDCVLPTRSGRTGQAFTRRGPINLKNARHRDDPRPIDEESDCPASRDYSRAYLHHLVKSGEILGAMLLSWSNVAYYQTLMREARAAIERRAFDAFRASFHERRACGDLPPR